MSEDVPRSGAAVAAESAGAPRNGVATRLWTWLFPDPGLGATLLAHQRKALRRQIPILIAVVVSISTLFAVAFWPFVPHAYLLAWLGLIWVMCGLSLLRWTRTRRVANERAPSRRFLRRSILANAIPGFAWGAAAIIFFVPDRVELQLLLVCVLAGMSAGIVAAAPSVPSAALAFVLPTMLPLTTQLLATGARTGVIMGIMAVIYVGALVFLLRNGYRSFCEGVLVEERARQAEEMLRDSIEALSDGYMLFDADLRVVMYNRRCLDHLPHFRGRALIGSTFEDHVRWGLEAGTFASDEVYVRDCDAAIAARRAEMRADRSSSVERRLADGRTLLIGTHPMSGGRRVAILTDITAIKRAEQRLISAIEAMNDGFILFGPDDRVILHNQCYLEHYPFLRELGSIVGRSREDLLRAALRAKALIAPAAERDPEHWVAQQVEALRRPGTAEYERQLADGRTLLVRAQPTAEGGRVAITIDITAVKRAEKRLIDAVECMSDAFVLWDAEDRMVLHNSAYARMFEGVPDAIAVGKTFAEILRTGINAGVFPEASGREEEYFRERLARHRNPGDPVIQPYRDGRWLRYAERKTSEGGIVGLRSDVTDSMRREQALRESQVELAARVRDLEAMQGQLQSQSDELRGLMAQVMNARDEAAAANAAKSVFLANMSHELRTPLNAIIGFAEIMSGELFGPLGHTRYSGYVGDIVGAARHLLKLINDILDLSKVEAGKWELREEPVDVRRMLDTVLRLFRGRDEAARLDIAVDAPASLPPILADERALKQIIINALSNAVKFTPAGGRIRVRARRDGKGRLHIAIADTGIGMRREDVPKALAPFGQVDSHMTRRHQGTGLGLSIAKALTEQHGGRLRIRSRPARGTVITVTLPAERFAAAARAMSPLVAAE